MSELNLNIPYNPTKPNHVKFVNLTGKVFGRLTVLAFYGRQNRHRIWLCQCVCKKVTLAFGTNLTRLHTKSCGCLNNEAMFGRISNGGCINGKVTPEYRIYTAAKMRCTNPKDVAFKNYGGRGIEFRFNSFEEFLSEVGRRPTPKHSIDRINVNGHYEKGNIQWATAKEQGRNRRNNVFLEINGQRKTISEWAEASPVKWCAINSRIKHGWCAECAVFNLPQKMCSHC